MKYCLSGRQGKKYLKKADEIFLEFRDHRIITDYFIDYPETMIILDIPAEDFTLDTQDILLNYREVSEKFCCKIYNLESAHWFKEHDIKFYYGYSVNSFYEVKGLIDLGVEYIQIHAPLTFCVDKLKTYNCKFRMVPNVAYDAYIPRQEGVCGQWVRPEDVEWYEEGIYVFDFKDANLEKEKVLYKIYAEDKKWNGNINSLITNLDKQSDNKIFPEEFGEFRSNCEQKCMINGRCKYCHSVFNLKQTIEENKERFKDLLIKYKENN